MKIVYITSESYLDHSYTIIKELKKKNELVVFMQAKEKTEEINNWCIKLNAEFVKRKRFRNPFGLFSEIGFLLSIKKIKADRVWFNTLTAYQAVIAKVLLKGFVVMVHDVEVHPETKDYYSVLSLRLTLALFKKNIGVASRSQAEIFKNKYGYEPKIFQLPVIDYYTETGIKAERTAADPERIKFFFFGSVEPYKGIETLVEAAEILENKNLSFHVNIYGRLKYNREELKDRIAQIKSVSMNDEFIHYKAIHKLYCENDVLILPYKQVTQCGPLLIGYNEEVPPICSNIEGFREYVDEGKTGLLFDNSAEDLARKMEIVIKNPALISEMKRYINSIAFNKFSMESLAGEYTQYLEN
jgi:glycosyltransferase involved in cell wall biosynthesis